MFERFTDRARAVVVSAQEEARLLQHNYIGTEHILLGLFSSPDSIGAQALRRLGITREMAVEDVESIIGPGKEKPGGHIPFTPRAKKVLELALREALQLKHNYIGTEHILLALVREGEGVAARILTERLDDVGKVRPTVMHLLSLGPELAPERTRRKKWTPATDEVSAATEALAGDAPVGTHHMLEALVRSEGSMAAKVLEALGVDAEAIAAKIDELDPEQTTDASPEEAAARKMELRVVDDEVQLVFRDEATITLATKVIEQSGGPIVGTGPISGALIPLWNATNEMLRKFAAAMEPENEVEAEAEGAFAKATVMMRRVVRGRLQRRRPPETG